MLLPVRTPLAGHMSIRVLRKVMTPSMRPHTAIEMRIWATETLKSSSVWPRTWIVMTIVESFSRGSRRLGSTTGIC